MSDTVRVEFQKFSGFITEYASNISLGGMFIKTDEPRSIGSELRFEIVLSDGFRLVQGTGEVAWTRSETQGPDKPAGMGIRFHDLDDSSRELIDKMVYHRLMDGGKPFELERPLEDPKAAEKPSDEPVAAELGAMDLPPEPELPFASEAPLAGAVLDTPEPAPSTPDPMAELPSLDSAPSLGLGDQPSLEVPGEPSMDLGNQPSFSDLHNALDSTPSTLVQPPPDLASGEDLSVDAAATVHLPLDSLRPDEPYASMDEDAPKLGEIALPPVELPAVDHLDSAALPEFGAAPAFGDTPPDPELSPVNLPDEFGGDPGPPPPPPTYSEPTGQELDDSLLSMDSGILPGAAADEPASLPSPSSDAPAFAPLAEPKAPALEPWGHDEHDEHDEDDEQDEDDWEEEPRRGLGRILLPVTLILLLGAAGYFLRDFWLPMVTGGSASSEVAPVAIDMPTEDSAEPSTEAALPGAEESPAGSVEETAQPAQASTRVPDDPRLKVIPPPAKVPEEPKADPVPAAAMTGIDRITWKAEPTGLQVTFWADGRVSGALISHHHIGGDNPRELIKIRGVSRPYAGNVEQVGDGRVKQIRFGYHKGDSGNEIHVVFDLSSGAVTVRDLDSSGSKISLVLN